MTSGQQEPSHRQAGSSWSAAPPKSSGLRTSRASLSDRALVWPRPLVIRCALGTCFVMIIGSLGPWATATVFGISVSVTGLHGGGWVTLITATVGAIVLLDPGWPARPAWLHHHRHAIWRLALGISALVCILNFFSVERDGLAGVVQPGPYITFIATLGALATEWALRPQTRLTPRGRRR